MYLIFKLHKKGFPVNQIYLDEVKPISTMRFNNELMEGQMNHAGIGIDKVTAITANGFVRQS
jgi:hypothetical protein